MREQCNIIVKKNLKVPDLKNGTNMFQEQMIENWWIKPAKRSMKKINSGRLKNGLKVEYQKVTKLEAKKGYR